MVKNLIEMTFRPYITRGHLPEYLGGNEIVLIPKKHCTIRMYNVLANENNQVYKD